ncbi:histidine phosphatase family protein [Varibaculum vaginae]|uniref:histidine phosphatase family protein n=1 Tax=Varibaculum vaginae TaxID=2364797 RepID=UPI000F095097|nr:histidine phosphatase family protein [Varibaculum vaginae]
MATKIIFWRHGQTDYNLQGRVQGQVDIPLNEAGISQAEAAAKELVKLSPQRIICSDLRRAQSTARALADICSQGAELLSDERLRERAFGDFEGLSAKELKERFAPRYEEWRATGECPLAGVESRAAVGSRVATCVLEHFEQVEGALVVVSHGSALTQGLVKILGLDPLAWQGLRGLDNCHWSTLIPYSREPGWRLVSHNLGVAGLASSTLPSIA